MSCKYIASIKAWERWTEVRHSDGLNEVMSSRVKKIKVGSSNLVVTHRWKLLSVNVSLYEIKSFFYTCCLPCISQLCANCREPYKRAHNFEQKNCTIDRTEIYRGSITGEGQWLYLKMVVKTTALESGL